MLSNYSFKKLIQKILLHQQFFNTHHQEHKQAHLFTSHLSVHPKTTRFLQLVQLHISQGFVRAGVPEPGFCKGDGAIFETQVELEPVV